MSTNLPLTAYLPYAPAPDPAAGPRPLAAIIADLSRPIHPRFIKTKTKGGAKLPYINWDTAIRLLHRYAPGWQSRPHLAMAGDQVVMVYELGIPTSDYGMVWRYGDGQNEDDEKGYGEASNRANSQALRRACAMFGLNMDAYDEDGLWSESPDDVVEEAATAEFAALQSAAQPARKSAAPTPIRAVAGGKPQEGTSSAEQRATIQRGFAALKLSSADQAAYLAEFNVKYVSELSSEQAAELIKYLAKIVRNKQAGS